MNFSSTPVRCLKLNGQYFRLTPSHSGGEELFSVSCLLDSTPGVRELKRVAMARFSEKKREGTVWVEPATCEEWRFWKWRQ